MIATAERNPMIATAAPKRMSVCTASAMADAPSRSSRMPTVWTHLPGGVVDGGEIVLLAIKPSMWRPLFDSLPWLVTTAVLAVTLIVLEAPFPGLSPLMTAQVILLVGAVRFLVAILRWVPMWYVLTNRRIIHLHGVRALRSASCLLLDIRNTYVHASGIERIAKLGTIIFAVDETDQRPPAWRSIARPVEVHGAIRRAIEDAIDHNGLGA